MNERINEITNDKKVERFFINPKEFDIISQTKKISISKFELSKAVTANAQSGEAGYALIARSYDKENRKFEDKVVNDLDEWIRDREKNLKNELKSFYGELNND